jgi:YVTN family beta-propeller protein
MTVLSIAKARATRGFAARLLILGIGFLVVGANRSARAADSTPLVLEAKIPLGTVHGRIDHLAFDTTRQYVYVAELGNDSVSVVDLKQNKVVRTLTGLHEPQGIGYVKSTDTIYVANAADGSVRLFRGVDLAPAGEIALGKDADNVRVDDLAHRVYVGYGSGALAVIDTATRTKVADIPLKEHPESFQLGHDGRHIFINIPDAHEIAVLDRAANRTVADWATDSLRANYPLALDEASHRVLAVFRHPARVGVFGEEDGRLVTSFETCGDSDDVFFDAKRRRLYVSCGEGFVDVFAEDGTGYRRIGHVATSGGARTALFVPDLDRLVLAVRATFVAPAAVWIYRPES